MCDVIIFGIIRCTHLRVSILKYVCVHIIIIYYTDTNTCILTTYRPAYLHPHMQNYIRQMKGFSSAYFGLLHMPSLILPTLANVRSRSTATVSVQQPQTYPDNHPVSRPAGCIPPASLLYDVLSAVLIKNQCPHLSWPAWPHVSRLCNLIISIITALGAIRLVPTALGSCGGKSCLPSHQLLLIMGCGCGREQRSCSSINNINSITPINQ